MKKISSWFLTIALLPLIFPVIFILYLISLFKPVYINRVDAGRIGHLYNTYHLLILRRIGGAQFILINYLDSSTNKVANWVWLKLFMKEMTIIPHLAFFFDKFFVILKRLGLKNKFHAPVKSFNVKEKPTPYSQIPNSKPLLSFSEGEIQQGLNYLKRFQTEPYKYICFFNRDPAYLNHFAPNHDWKHHDYRDSSVRHYQKMVNYFSAKKLHSFRMGSITSEKFEVNDPFVHDYANSPDRSDFLDIYLSAYCKFFILTDSGISIFSELFARPIAFCNVVPICRFSPAGYLNIFIPKKFMKKSQQRQMTFREIFAIGDIEFTAKEINSLDLELIENTDDEILDMALELESKLLGTYQESAEEKALLNKYWELHPRKFLRRGNFEISGSYLLKNRHLLS